VRNSQGLRACGLDSLFLLLKLDDNVPFRTI
jgi:hypothetical protein